MTVKPGNVDSLIENTLKTPHSVPEIVTGTCEFGEVAIHQRNMFAVLEGMPVATALSHAACIVDGLREMAHDGVEAGGIGASMAWLMSNNLSTVFALLVNAESAIERSAWAS
jgi:hypothetical protein